MGETSIDTSSNAKPVATAIEDSQSLSRSLEPMLPGIDQNDDDAVTVTVQPYDRTNEEAWSSLLADTGEYAIEQKRGILAQMRSLLETDRKARASGKSLRDVAEDVAARSREAIHRAWVGLRQANQGLEKAITAVDLLFSNMDHSRRFWKHKMHFINASTKELGTKAGLEFLDRELARYAKRPDPRESRAYLVAMGYAGSPTALRRIGETTQSHRCILISDAPGFSDLDRLEIAARPGGALESFSGNDLWHRYAILFGNEGRVREGFRSEHVSEDDVYIPLSIPWFGGLLRKLAEGEPWNPPLGYDHPIPGVDSVQLDLLLEQEHGFDFYVRHRINPMIRRADGSSQIVTWGPDTLCKAGGGVQIGVAAVEMILVRYTEWIVNKYALLHDLEESENTVGQILTDFMVANRGHGRMFLSDSNVHVHADDDRRCLVVDFDLQFRELAEGAEIRACKFSLAKKPGERPGEVTVD